MSKEWDEMWTDFDKHACKICGIYRCFLHVMEQWVVCPGCPSHGKYSLKYHPKCPYCGAEPPVAQKR